MKPFQWPVADDRHGSAGRNPIWQVERLEIPRHVAAHRRAERSGYRRWWLLSLSIVTILGLVIILAIGAERQYDIPSRKCSGEGMSDQREAALVRSESARSSSRGGNRWRANDGQARIR